MFILLLLLVQQTQTSLVHPKGAHAHTILCHDTNNNHHRFCDQLQRVTCTLDETWSCHFIPRHLKHYLKLRVNDDIIEIEVDDTPTPKQNVQSWIAAIGVILVSCLFPYVISGTIYMLTGAFLHAIFQPDEHISVELDYGI